MIMFRYLRVNVLGEQTSVERRCGLRLRSGGQPEPVEVLALRALRPR